MQAVLVERRVQPFDVEPLARIMKTEAPCGEPVIEGAADIAHVAPGSICFRAGHVTECEGLDAGEKEADPRAGPEPESVGVCPGKRSVSSDDLGLADDGVKD